MGPGPRAYALGRDDTLLLPSRLHPALEIDQRQRALVFGRLLEGAVIESVDPVPTATCAHGTSRPTTCRSMWIWISREGEQQLSSPRKRGPIRRALSMNCGVWAVALALMRSAGTTRFYSLRVSIQRLR